ncbi:hypothetical protein HOLleu_22115 [Holothuria leucospilota]|uniref:Uncharacterized protein n=1 Tax=Holothuria leucospilota TaxID=206669 RepID=A0A9Q1BY37_HOLLE|nr:hypothetical protein HOLleu_22115 [Holothuria leucospilota]
MIWRRKVMEVTLSTKTVVEHGFGGETQKTKEVTGEHANNCTFNLNRKETVSRKCIGICHSLEWPWL